MHYFFVCLFMLLFFSHWSFYCKCYYFCLIFDAIIFFMLVVVLFLHNATTIHMLVVVVFFSYWCCFFHVVLLLFSLSSCFSFVAVIFHAWCYCLFPMVPLNLILINEKNYNYVVKIRCGNRFLLYMQKLLYLITKWIWKISKFQYLGQFSINQKYIYWKTNQVFITSCKDQNKSIFIKNENCPKLVLTCIG